MRKCHPSALLNSLNGTYQERNTDEQIFTTNLRNGVHLSLPYEQATEIMNPSIADDNSPFHVSSSGVANCGGENFQLFLSHLHALATEVDIRHSIHRQ